MALFPEPPDRDGFAGMTVNERLFAAGILDQFDEAVARRGSREGRRITANSQHRSPANGNDCRNSNRETPSLRRARTLDQAVLLT